MSHWGKQDGDVVEEPVRVEPVRRFGVRDVNVEESDKVIEEVHGAITSLQVVQIDAPGTGLGGKLITYARETLDVMGW